MPLARGAVYRAVTELPGPGGVGTQELVKYRIALQDPERIDPAATYFAYVLGSSHRSDRQPRLHEALVRAAESDIFSVDTIVDGRWVMSGSRIDLHEEDFCGILDDEAMQNVADAVFAGLQIDY